MGQQTSRLIGEMAVNCYVEPVYTLDADIVVTAANLKSISGRRPDSASQLRTQFTTDERYQTFPARSIAATVLGQPVKIACLEDVTQGKLWAYSDPNRRLSKRKKDELDLIRLAESYPHLKSTYPPELQQQIDRG